MADKFQDVLACWNDHMPLSNRRFIGAATDETHRSSYRCHLYPLVVMDGIHFDIDTNDAISSKLISFKLHAAECQFARLVHQLRIFFQFALKVPFDTRQPVAYSSH